MGSILEAVMLVVCNGLLTLILRPTLVIAVVLLEPVRFPLGDLVLACGTLRSRHRIHFAAKLVVVEIACVQANRVQERGARLHIDVVEFWRVRGGGGL